MAGALVDTGVFLALLHRGDRWHEIAARELARGGRLLTTWPVVTETVHMIGRSDASIAFLEYLARGAVDIPQFGSAETESLAWYFRKYADREPDLADLSLLVLADLSGSTSVLTFDRDFLVYRTRKRRALHCPLLADRT
jgi:uncharacterized protein